MSEDQAPGDDLQVSIHRASAALGALSRTQPDVAALLARLVSAAAEEAGTNSRFAEALLGVAAPPTQAPRRPRDSINEPGQGDRRARRAPGPWDPFVVYRESGEDGLRERFGTLTIEQLRDMIAEHGMDNDRLALKWRSPERLQGRIVERVVDRAAKGEGFRA